jgi:hypothetical protein
MGQRGHTIAATLLAATMVACCCESPELELACQQFHVDTTSGADNQ